MRKRPRTDVTIVVLHAVATVVIIVSLVSGMRIAADGAPESWSAALGALGPGRNVYGWHVAGAFVLAAVGLGYWLYLKLTGLGERLHPDRQTIDEQLKAGVFRLNLRIWLVLYGILILLGLSGSAMFLDLDFDSELATAWVVEVHFVAAWALVAGVALHIIAQYAQGTVLAERGWARLAGGASWLMKVVRPDITPAATGAAARYDLRAFVDEITPSSQRLWAYLAGCAAFSLGVKCFIDAGLGLDPLHAFTIAIVSWLDTPFLRIGFIDSALTAALLVLWSWGNRRLPPLTIFVTMAIVGYLVDLWNTSGLEQATTALLPRAALLAVGLLLYAYGSALIIMSGIGLRVVDLVAVSLMTLSGRRPFWVAKFGIEICFFAGAWALGGPLGVATVAFLLVVGPAIAPLMWLSRRFLGLPNHGLPADRRGERQAAGRASPP